MNDLAAFFQKKYSSFPAQNQKIQEEVCNSISQELLRYSIDEAVVVFDTEQYAVLMEPKNELMNFCAIHKEKQFRCSFLLKKENTIQIRRKLLEAHELREGIKDFIDADIK